MKMVNVKNGTVLIDDGFMRKIEYKAITLLGDVPEDDQYSLICKTNICKREGTFLAVGTVCVVCKINSDMS